VKFLKFCFALLLWPLLFASIQLSTDLISHQQGVKEPFDLILFAAGVVTAAIAFALLPKPNWLYVFGHESTHALAVWLSRGKVSEFKASSEGGYIVADKNSTWISLSPYLVPLYPLLITFLWWIALLIDPSLFDYKLVFFYCIGVAWGYHWLFTGQLLFTPQPDFIEHGRLYSLTVIALINVWIINLAVWILFTSISLPDFLQRSKDQILFAYQITGRWFIDVFGALI